MTVIVQQKHNSAYMCALVPVPVRLCVRLCVCVPPVVMIMRTVIAVCIDEGGNADPRRVDRSPRGLSLDALSQ